MLQKFRTYVGHTFHSALFRRLLISTSCILLVLVLAVGAVTGLTTTSVWRDMMAANMTAAQEQLGQYASTLTAEMVALFSDMLTNTDITQYLCGTSPDKVTDYLAYCALAHYKALYPFVENLTLVNLEMDSSLSNIYRQRDIQFFQQHANNDLYVARNIYPYTASSPLANSALPVISLIFPFTTNAQVNTRGVIIDISQTYFQSLLSPTAAQVSFVVDQNGLVVSHTDSTQFLLDLSGHPCVKQSLAAGGGSGSFFVSISNTKWMVSYTYLEDSGWCCVSMYPTRTLNASLQSMFLTLFVCLFILLLITLLVSFFSLKKSYAPLGNLTMAYRSPYDTESSQSFDDVLLLSSAFSSLKTENVELKSYLNQSYLYSLLSGAATSQPLELTERQMEEYQADTYAVGLVKTAEQDMLHQAAAVVEQHIRRKCAGEAALCGNAIVILWKIMGKQLPDEWVQDLLSSLIPYPAYIALSDPVDSTDKVHIALRQAQDLLQNRFYFDTGYVIDSCSAQQHSGIALSDESLIIQLVGDIQHMAPDAADSHLTFLLTHMQSLRPDVCRSCAQRFWELLERSLTLQNSEIERILLEGYSMIATAPSFCALTEDLRSRIMACIVELSNARERNAKARNRELVDGVCQHIQTHYSDANLSLDDIATSIGLSAGYISRIFRGETGKSLNEYITETRINQASELLTNSQITVSEIANKVGFNSVSYFITQFKRFKHVTPKQYQQESANCT